MGGLLDLYTKLPHAPSAWVELKFVNIADKKVRPESVNLNLSGQQREFIRKERKAGGKAGWMILVQLDDFETVILSGIDHTCKTIAVSDLLCQGSIGRQYRRSHQELSKLFEVIVAQ